MLLLSTVKELKKKKEKGKEYCMEIRKKPFCCCFFVFRFVYSFFFFLLLFTANFTFCYLFFFLKNSVLFSFLVSGENKKEKIFPDRSKNKKDFLCFVVSFFMCSFFLLLLPHLFFLLLNGFTKADKVRSH